MPLPTVAETPRLDEGGDAAVGDEAPEEQQRGELLLGRALGVERIGHGRLRLLVGVGHPDAEGELRVGQPAADVDDTFDGHRRL